METPVPFSRDIFDFLSLLQACWRIGITGFPVLGSQSDPVPFFSFTCGLSLVLLGPFLGVIAAFFRLFGL